ncbi:energy transducer TonB [Aquimarina pacifica]|uniref:energy transducer TonB n=1 Tax=Aquimarina pacifica TaxID=1296415 RepID=UPI00046E7C22|nr:energy transducer TonB [Aquimarina pacifica]
MKKLLLFTMLSFSSVLFSQESIVLSSESATEKGISPIWPKCDRSRQTPIDCFNQKLMTHIIQNFQYPEIALSESLSGTVTVEFIINKKGKVEVIDVKGGHRYLQREAIRIIRAIPRMKPALWGTKPIAIAYAAPITFIKPK